MGWREYLIALHEKDIAQFKQGIDMMEKGILSTGEINSGGRPVDTTAGSIEHYKRIVAELESLVAKIRADA